MRKTLQLFLLIVFFHASSSAQGYLHRSGTTIMDGNNQEIILHGIGIGGWMLQEGYMYGNSGNYYTQHALKAKLSALIGASETERFYTNWRHNFMQRRDIDSIAAWGFNSIRVPMHYNLFRRCFATDPQNDEGFRLIDSLVTWASAKNVYLILDMHATPGGQGDDTGISDRDATKPYLWTSTANQDTLVQVWKNIATKYANQPIVGGYDLINETNYAPMKPSNQLLRDLYIRITTAIRQVDTNHILFVEGNDFANNFTGLTPAWDENMAYSFHKYWNATDKSSIQWMLDLRTSSNRPIWLGETGENGNAWFTAVIKTMEANKIGYANWPYKPYDKIQSPVTIKAFANWQKVLDYVNNNTSLPATDCITYLNQMTDGLLLENCRINKDEIDAWARQPFDDMPKPYVKNTIPGIIFAANYDMGTQGVAYNDKVVQTLAQSPWTAWNNGYVYRNDGVDIEACTDVAPYNMGYSVGWTEDNEWMLYTVDVASAGVYNLSLRCSSGTTALGYLHIEMDDRDVSGTVTISGTGGWQAWKDVVVNGITLPAGRHKMKIVFDKANYNINAVNWTVSTSPVVMRLMSATGVDDTVLRLRYNKALTTSIGPNASDFKINSATSHPISKVVYDPEDPNSLLIYSQNNIFYNETLTLDYSGSNLQSVDADVIPAFTSRVVLNKIAPRYIIAGKVESENYSTMSGIVTETCTDTGGGSDIGYTNAGDYMEYPVYVQAAGNYNVTFRMAGNGGKVSLYYDDPTNTSLIGSVTFSSTGGWQTWKDFMTSVPLTAGVHTLKVVVDVEGFNLNYMNFVQNTTAVETHLADVSFDIFPNPVSNEFTLTYTPESNSARLDIFNLQGVSVLSDTFTKSAYIKNKYNISNLKKGVYLVEITDGGRLMTRKLVVK